MILLRFMRLNGLRLKDIVITNTTICVTRWPWKPTKIYDSGIYIDIFIYKKILMKIYIKKYCKISKIRIEYSRIWKKFMLGNWCKYLWYGR